MSDGRRHIEGAAVGVSSQSWGVAVVEDFNPKRYSWTIHWEEMIERRGTVNDGMITHGGALIFIDEVHFQLEVHRSDVAT